MNRWALFLEGFWCRFCWTGTRTHGGSWLEAYCNARSCTRKRVAS